MSSKNTTIYRNNRNNKINTCNEIDMILLTLNK